MEHKIIDKLSELFHKTFDEHAENITQLPLSGSNRIYYRLSKGKRSAIGTFNKDLRENQAFIHFSEFFKQRSITVPKIFAHDLNNDIYLQEDLGNDSLYDLVMNRDMSREFSNDLLLKYKQALSSLISFQLEGANIDTNFCYPRAAFDRQSMQWDLNYFKYYFLKLACIQFDEQFIEDDFNTLINYLDGVDSQYFIYRDFQSRNILIRNSDLYFIDYQGGRKGPLQYDVASLLFQVKAEIPFETREQLLDYYLDAVNEKIKINREKFVKEYYAVVLIRLLQVMGAYGYRGFFERKQHWLTSIPYAQKNIAWLLKNVEFDFELPHLFEVLKQISEKEIPMNAENTTLTVQINSFSYKRGIPVELAGNGGGHVFDCRALPNPGRMEGFKKLTGMDNAVKEYLESKKETHDFKQHSFFLVEQSIKNYLERGFSNLMINFGCTGGQHRSVYFAQQLADYLKDKYDIVIDLRHREQE